MGLAAKAKVGLPQQFKMLAASDTSTNDLQGIYNMGMLVQQYGHALHSQDMHDMFMIVDEFDLASKDDLVPSKQAKLVDLLTSYNDLDLKTIKRNSAYVCEYGRDCHVENLMWSCEKLLNSCEIPF
jgi:hypothetical protein